MKRFGRSEKSAGQGAEALSVALGRHILRTGDTVRACAERFGMSKSYAHQLIGAPLRRADEALYDRVQTVMEEHLAVRHLRGGAATREKYRRLRAAAREEKRRTEAEVGAPESDQRGG